MKKSILSLAASAAIVLTVAGCGDTGNSSGYFSSLYYDLQTSYASVETEQSVLQSQYDALQANYDAALSREQDLKAEISEYSAAAVAEPDVSAAVPEDTVSTTAAVTTAKPAVTTAKPAVTTAKPAVTTAKPTTKQKYEYTVLSTSWSKDYEDKDVLVVEYSFTNNSSEATSFLFAGSVTVYQDGIECDSTVFGCDDIDGQKIMNNVQPGYSYTVKDGYHASKSGGNVEIIINELFDKKTEYLHYTVKV